VIDDVLDDVLWRVVDAAGFLDLWLLFHLHAMFRREADGLAQELLVDAAQDGDV